MQVRPVARPRAAQPRPCEHVSRHYMQAVLVHLMPGVRSAPPCTVVPGAGADKEKKGTNAVPAPCVAWRLAASGRRAAGWLATASGEKAAAGRGNTMSAVPSISTRSASIALSGLQLAGSYALEKFSTGRKKMHFLPLLFLREAETGSGKRLPLHSRSESRRSV